MKERYLQYNDRFRYIYQNPIFENIKQKEYAKAMGISKSVLSSIITQTGQKRYLRDNHITGLVDLLNEKMGDDFISVAWFRSKIRISIENRAGSEKASLSNKLIRVSQLRAVWLILKSKGLTVKEIAKQCDIQEISVYNVLEEKTKSMNVISYLVDVHGVSLRYLLGYSKNMFREDSV